MTTVTLEALSQKDPDYQVAFEAGKYWAVHCATPCQLWEFLQFVRNEAPLRFCLTSNTGAIMINGESSTLQVDITADNPRKSFRNADPGALGQGLIAGVEEICRTLSRNLGFAN